MSEARDCAAYRVLIAENRCSDTSAFRHLPNVGSWRIPSGARQRGCWRISPLITGYPTSGSIASATALLTEPSSGWMGNGGCPGLSPS